jgi:predicted RNase H-like nuclease
MTLVAGVDGCRGGWLIVASPPFLFDGAKARVAKSLPAAEDSALMIIDIPVGLSAAQDIARATDAAARTYLRDRNSEGHRSPGSRVFSAPSRVALDLFRNGESYNAINAQLTGPRMTRQAFHITGKISEVDDWMTPGRQLTAREGHPEVAFATLTGRTLAPKKTREGAAARRHALADLGFDTAALARSLGPKSGVWIEDDLNDACVLAWVASRVLTGSHITLPDHLPPADARGLRMEIVS